MTNGPFGLFSQTMGDMLKGRFYEEVKCAEDCLMATRLVITGEDAAKVGFANASRSPRSSSTASIAAGGRWRARAETDVPRGLEFLLSRSRLNVAISRALPRVPRREPAAARGELQDDPADAARERTLPFRRARGVRRLFPIFHSGIKVFEDT
jgi:hypothetical protein